MPPQGPLRMVFGQFIGHDMPVLESTQFPHILQSKNRALPVASSLVIGLSSRVPTARVTIRSSPTMAGLTRV